MDNNLNGFEIFDDLMPGAIANRNNTIEQPKLDDIDAAEPMTDEELAALRNPKVDMEDEIDTEDIIEEPVKTTKKTTSKKKEDDANVDTDVIDDNTSDTDSDDNNNLVGTFFDTMAEVLGWEDVEDDEKPKTPEELVNYFKDVIQENSTPQYASDEVEALDNFVKNGGNLRDYFQIDGGLDLESLEIEDNETNQKAVLREFLKEKGYKSNLIDKKLSKYEDAGILEDEATDALEALREIREAKKEKLLKDLQRAATEALERQQAYFTSVVNEIKGMDNIRGIKIPEKDKRQLLEYIFKPTANGQTQYLRDYAKSVKNLLESAYFTMKGDTLLKAAKTEGSNSAIDRFKNSLSRTGVSRKTNRQENTSNLTMWDSFVRQFRAE